MVTRQIRFNRDGVQIAEAMAARKGISLSEFVREAVITRVAYEMGKQGDETIDAIIARLDELRRDG